MFMAAGHGFHSSSGGGRLKKYICNGVTGGCRAVVRACKQQSKEFKGAFVVAEHKDCFGGKVETKTAALMSLASSRIVSNPNMEGTG